MSGNRILPGIRLSTSILASSALSIKVLVPVGQKLAAPAHKNDAYEEILYGIEGILTWTVDGRPIEVGPGQALCIPRGAVHRFDKSRERGCETARRYLACDNGPGILQRSRRSNRRRGRWPARSREMTDVFRRHRMTLAAPPRI